MECSQGSTLDVNKEDSSTCVNGKCVLEEGTFVHVCMFLLIAVCKSVVLIHLTTRRHYWNSCFLVILWVYWLQKCQLSLLQINNSLHAQNIQNPIWISLLSHAAIQISHQYELLVTWFFTFPSWTTFGIKLYFIFCLTEKSQIFMFLFHLEILTRGKQQMTNIRNSVNQLL